MEKILPVHEKGKISIGLSKLSAQMIIIYATMRPRHHCLRFQILHAIYSQFSSLASC